MGFPKTLGVIAGLVLMFATGKADAAPDLDHAEPNGGRVWSMPREVTLYFNEKLVPWNSSVTVTGPSGRRVDAALSRVNGKQISIPLKDDGVGTYRVNYDVRSAVDNHTTDGFFIFEVVQ